MESSTQTHLGLLRASYELVHQQLLKRLDSYAIILSLLLSCSYCGFLQIPISLAGSQPSNSSNFVQIFMYANGLSFFSSVAGLLVFASSSFSALQGLDFSCLGNAEKEVEKRVELLAHMLPRFFYVILFFGVSLTFLVLAYIFAGLSIVRSVPTEQLAVIITAVIGGLFYLQAIWVCGRNAYQLLQGSMRQNQKLWDAFKERTWFGLWLASYVVFVGGDTAVKNQSSDREQNVPA